MFFSSSENGRNVVLCRSARARQTNHRLKTEYVQRNVTMMVKNFNKKMPQLQIPQSAAFSATHFIIEFTDC